jgi:hypothetical protein
MVKASEIIKDFFSTDLPGSFDKLGMKAGVLLTQRHIARRFFEG